MGGRRPSNFLSWISNEREFAPLSSHQRRDGRAKRSSRAGKKRRVKERWHEGGEVWREGWLVGSQRPWNEGERAKSRVESSFRAPFFDTTHFSGTFSFSVCSLPFVRSFVRSLARSLARSFVRSFVRWTSFFSSFFRHGPESKTLFNSDMARGGRRDAAWRGGRWSTVFIGARFWFTRTADAGSFLSNPELRAKRDSDEPPFPWMTVIYTPPRVAASSKWKGKYGETVESDRSAIRPGRLISWRNVG